MKNGTSVVNLWRDREGATFLEFTLVFPLLMLTALCTVDFAMIMIDWAQANKATQRGARFAVVSPPVAGGIDTFEWAEDLGAWCVDPDTGDATGLCPTIETVDCEFDATAGDIECTEDGAPSEYVFDDAAFTPILEHMRAASPFLDLQRENVRISYRPTGLGFVGRPGGLPLEVTVGLRCMNHEVYFLVALAGWAFTPRADCPGDSGVPLPSFATTLTTESLGS